MKELLWIGTYSEPILFGTGKWFRGKGEGLYLCAFEEGKLTVLDCLKMGNPSFLAVNEEKRHVYAVNEMKEFRGAPGGGLTDIVCDEKGGMAVAGSFPTHGGDPCHVAVSPDGRFVCAANYADGTVTVFRLDASGAVLPNPEVFRHRGAGNGPRRASPHAHGILFLQDGTMFVPDLGLDRLMAYRVADAGIVPWEEKTVLLPPGTGPRAAVRSGDGEHLYVMGELSSSVLHLKYRNGTAVIRQSVSALPEDFRGDSAGADVRLTPDGRFLYASNRGHDSLAMFRVDGQGDLSLLGWVSCGGKTPRNFAVDPAGRFVLAGNQDSDFIRVFSVCGDGSLAPAGDIPFPTPVCIRFLTGI